ncbi:hypothetical protein [Stenotrophomonas sp. Iso1]|uniref:hypothetical protein n=1 Tax=Stenotrophomonas sp. Iso1 TaxID=2977283 RepID=UPI0022B770C9|nr:hypothetical protein [Stenotrophomonas sp. Iso1]
MRYVTRLTVITLLTCFFAMTAHSQPVFKCSEAGTVSYQSLPCEGATLRSWDATPDAVAPSMQTRIASLRREARPERRASGRYRSGRSRKAPAATACERARKGRAEAYAKAGLKRDFALSSHWDNRVHDACW